MEFHVITPYGSELIAQTVDGKLVIVPPPVNPPATHHKPAP